MDREKRTSLTGVLYGVAAFSVWGVLPAYWKMLHEVPALEILSHRIFWSLLFVALLLFVKGDLPAVRQALKCKKSRLALILSAAIISVNWGTYIWAVNSNHIVETSLGYYINPIFNVFLGMLLLRERLNFWQYAAVALAATGVVYMTFQCDRFPWVAIVLAVSFGLYGFLKKTVSVPSLTALGVETLLISPFCAGFLGYRFFQGEGALGHASLSIQALLLLAGVITALPLFWFAQSARMIPLSQVGFLQYIGPSLALLLGVFAYGEPFTQAHAVSFGCIWSALLLYSFSGTPFLRNLQPAKFRFK